MSLARTITKRSLVARPGRTLFAVLGIAVGIATVVGIFTLDYNTVLGLSTPDRSDWKAEIEVSPSVQVVDPKKDLSAIPGITKVSAFFQNDVLIRPQSAPQGTKPVRIRLFAVEAQDAASFGMYRLLAGDHVDPLGLDRHEVLLAEPLAAALGIDVGDAVILERPRRAARKRCVEGRLEVVRDPEPLPPKRERFVVCGIIAKEGLGHRAQGAVCVVDYARGVELFEGAHIDRRFAVKKDPDVDLETLQASLGQAYSYDLSKSVIVGQAADERAFRNGVRFAGLLALVLGLFVIFHTLSIALLERIREIATLSALGASRRQIARVFLTEATTLATLGGALGLALGLGLAKALLSARITTLGLGKYVPIFEIPWETVIPLTLAGMGIALAGSIYPLLRLRSINVAVALRGDDQPHARAALAATRGFRIFSAVLLAVVLPGLYFSIVPVVGEAKGALLGILLFGAAMLIFLVALPLLAPAALARLTSLIARPFEERWPLAGRLTSRSMRNRPTRIAVASIGIAMVAAAFVSLRGMTASLRAELEVWGDRAAVHKVFVRNIDEQPFEELAAALHEIPGVIGVERGDSRTYVPFLLIGLPVDELTRYGPCARNAAVFDALRDGRGIIVSERLARDLDYAVGSKVHVKSPNGVLTFRVAAISDEYGYFPHPDERMYAVVGDRRLAHDFCIESSKTTRVGVRFDDDVTPDAAKAALVAATRERFPGADAWKFETGASLVEAGLADIDRDFVLFDIIIALTALLAGLGVLNGQLLSALERTKELGILRALGTSRRQIAGMVLLESAVIGILGGGLGLLIGLLMTPVAVHAIEAISALPLPYRTGGVAIPLAFAGALLLAVAASFYPMWRMQRLRAVEAIRSG